MLRVAWFVGAPSHHGGLPPPSWDLLLVGAAPCGRLRAPPAGAASAGRSDGLRAARAAAVSCGCWGGSTASPKPRTSPLGATLRWEQREVRGFEAGFARRGAARRSPRCSGGPAGGVRTQRAALR